jgi:hypothetical protein
VGRKLVAYRTAAVSTAAALLCIAMGLRAQSHDSADRWNKVSVELPVSTELFAGDGASIANAHCLTCHSVDMVLMQPPRTAQQWTDTINKMRTAYGAPIPSDRVGALALYLSRMQLAH